MRWLLPFLLLGLDFGSKLWALAFVAPLGLGVYPFGGTPVFSNLFGISFSLNVIGNTGAAWGMFAGNPGLLFFVRLLIIAGFGFSLYFFDRPMIKRIPLLCIGAGAIGNAIDYLLYGHVIDFFHFNFWGYSFPIFNLADAYISLGALALLLYKPSLKSHSVS